MCGIHDMYYGEVKVIEGDHKGREGQLQPAYPTLSPAAAYKVRLRETRNIFTKAIEHPASDVQLRGDQLEQTGALRQATLEGTLGLESCVKGILGCLSGQASLSLSASLLPPSFVLLRLLVRLLFLLQFLPSSLGQFPG